MKLKPFNPNGCSGDHELRTNGMRADRANWALQQYVQYESDCPCDESLTDLLADLQHLAHREGWDFKRALRSARMHFKAETNGL